MPKPIIVVKGEKLDVQRLTVQDKPLWEGGELEYAPTKTRFRVHCIAASLVDKDQLYVVLAPDLGFDPSMYIVPYEALNDGNWSNLGL